MRTTRRRIRIIIRGSLSERLAAAFDGLVPVRRGDRTELVGEIVDQAQLHGLLTRIRDLGLELEGVSLLPAEKRRRPQRPRPQPGRDAEQEASEPKEG